MDSNEEFGAAVDTQCGGSEEAPALTPTSRATKLDPGTGWRSAFGGDTATTLAANGVLVLLSLITGPLVARLLGVVGRGQIAVIQMFAMPLSTLAMVGQMESVVYHAARDKRRTGAYVTTGTLLALCASPIFVIIGYFLLPILLHRQDPGLVFAARWYLVLIPLYGLICVPVQGLRPGHMRSWNVWRILPNAAWLFAVMAAALLHAERPTAIAAGHLIALAAAVPVVFWAVKRRVHSEFRLERSVIMPMLRFGIPSSLGTMSQWLNIRIDQLLMVVILPTAGIGLYSVASGWSSALLPAFTALAFVALPRVASAQSHTERVARFGTSVRRALLTGIALLLVGLPVTPFAVPLIFGTEFKAAVPASMILMLGIAVAGINIVVEDGLRGLGAPKAVFAAECVGWISTAVSVLLLAKAYGLIGIAFSSMVGYLITFVILAVFVAQKTRVPLPQTFMPTVDDIQSISRVLLRAKG